MNERNEPISSGGCWAHGSNFTSNQQLLFASVFYNALSETIQPLQKQCDDLARTPHSRWPGDLMRISLVISPTALVSIGKMGV